MDWLLLAGFCGFLFFFGLAYFGLLGADEPRYAQVAREMLARHDWITPTLGGKPWLEKPALYYWQTMLAYSVFGVSDWAARLPSAVDATLMVVAVYLFLRRFRPGFQLDGALMAASASGVIGFARAASMDMPLAATSPSQCWPGMHGTRAPASVTWRSLTSSWDSRCWPKGQWRHSSRWSIVVIFAAGEGRLSARRKNMLAARHRVVRFDRPSLVRRGPVEKSGILPSIHS